MARKGKFSGKRKPEELYFLHYSETLDSNPKHSSYFKIVYASLLSSMPGFLPNATYGAGDVLVICSRGDDPPAHVVCCDIGFDYNSAYRYIADNWRMLGEGITRCIGLAVVSTTYTKLQDIAYTCKFESPLMCK